MSTTAKKNGRITQVIGSTFDAEFAEDSLPPIYNAVRVTSKAKGVDIDLTGEIQQHLGGGRVRCVALGSTEGLMRGLDCVDTVVLFRFPLVQRRSDACSMCWAIRSIVAAKFPPMTTGPFTAALHHWINSPPTPKCSKRASRLLTC